jgi:hypothetical protein
VDSKNARLAQPIGTNVDFQIENRATDGTRLPLFSEAGPSESHRFLGST